MFIKTKILSLVVVLLVEAISAIPMPRDDFDIPDENSAVLPRYEFDMPIPLPIPSPVVSTQIAPEKNKEEDSQVNSEISIEMDKNILRALLDMETFGKQLEADMQYIENRKVEDPSWPSGLSARIQAKVATEDEVRRFNEDVERSVSVTVIMKMMELRLSLINDYVKKTVAENPKADLNVLFGRTEGLPVIQGLFEMKYFEGLLHSVNGMLEETLTDDILNTPVLVPTFTPDGPVYPDLEESELVLEFTTLAVLFFTGTGFLFVFFLVIYLALKAVKKCQEKVLDYDKKLKYEQI